MKRIKEINFRTKTGEGGPAWDIEKHTVDMDDPRCPYCNATLWVMGKTVYCNEWAPDHHKKQTENVEKS